MKQRLQFSRPLRCLPSRHRVLGGIEFGRLVVSREFWRDVAMSQSADLWKKVAECERVIDASADPDQREVLTHLRTLWVNLARESPHLDGGAVEAQTTALIRIHIDLMRAAVAATDSGGAET
jgi:hypothetical protein